MNNKKTFEWRKTKKSFKYTQMFVSENSLCSNELDLLLKYLDLLLCVDGLCEERLSRLTPKTTSASGLAAGPGRLLECSHYRHWETWQKRETCGELAAFLETEPGGDKKSTKSQKETWEEESWGSPKGAEWRCSWWLLPSCSDTGAQRHINLAGHSVQVLPSLHTWTWCLTCKADNIQNPCLSLLLPWRLA